MSIDLHNHYITLNSQINLDSLCDDILELGNNDLIFEFMKKLDMGMEDYDGSIAYCQWLIKSLMEDQEGDTNQFILELLNIDTP